MNNINDNVSETSASVVKIDYKRIIYHALHYWYVIVLTLLVALAVAYVNNRYATRIYPVTASIIIKEAKTTSGAELLYNNVLVNYERNYYNELYILRSYPLIQRVIEDLNFDVSFYREGNILTTEVYADIPVTVNVYNNNGIRSKLFLFQILDERRFELRNYGEPESSSEGKVFNFGDSIEYGGIECMVQIIKKEMIPRYVGSTLVFSYSSAEVLTPTYVNKLAVGWAEEGAGVINLYTSGPNPAKDLDFLNGLISQYQSYDLENKNQVASRTIDFITSQLTNVSDSLQRIETRMQRFKNNNSVSSLSTGTARIEQKLEGLEEEKARLLFIRNYYKYLKEYINNYQNFEQVVLPSTVDIKDPMLTQLVMTLGELQLETRLTTKVENPRVTQARRKIEEVKKDILESVKNLEVTDNLQIRYLDTQIKEVEKQLNNIPAAERNYIAIQRNYSLLENLYIYLLQKRSEADISKASNSSDIVVVNPPKQGGAVSPKISRNYFIAIAAGIGLPILVFVLIEIFNTRIQSKEDIEKITTIPFIGGVGHKTSDNNLEVLTHPKTAVAESFRALRSNLSYFLGQKERAIFLVTSSISGEGKTFTSINLAAVMNLAGKSTLIIGADLRKPRLYSDFDLNNDVGLSNYLAGMAEFNQVIQKSKFDKLHLVSGGPVPPNPSELLLTDRMKQFMDEAKKHYEVIIIDSPPIGIVTDAFSLIHFADHTLFIVRQNYTPKNLLRTTQDFFVSGKLQNVSIVLNDIYRSGPGYGYGYGYDYGYGYGYGYGRRKNGYGYYSS